MSIVTRPFLCKRVKGLHGHETNGILFDKEIPMLTKHSGEGHVVNTMSS